MKRDVATDIITEMEKRMNGQISIMFVFVCVAICFGRFGYALWGFLNGILEIGIEDDDDDGDGDDEEEIDGDTVRSMCLYLIKP